MTAPVLRPAFAHLTGDEAMQAIRFKDHVASLADTSREEALADEAFLAMAKLRDRLIGADRNIAACRVDEAIEKLQAACREFVK